MNKILSIIVPGYNISQTLDQLMDSLICSCEIDSIEIIIVNDGSTDNTLAKALEYKDKYPHIVKVIDKENGGHGSTLNVGIRASNADYIQVIDGDDWVNVTNFNALVNKLRTTKCDLILSPYTEFYCDSNMQLDKQVDCDFSAIEKNVIYSFDDVVAHLGHIGMVSIIYNRSIFIKNKIFIDENIFYDDNEFVAYPLKYIRSVLFSTNPIYVYRLGQSNQSVSGKNLWARRADYNTVVRSLIKFYATIEESNNIKTYLKNFISGCIQYYYYIYINYGDGTIESGNELKHFDEFIKKFDNGLYKTVRGNKILLLRTTKFLAYSFIVKCSIHKQK